MNVIKELLDTKEFSNVKLAEEMIKGIFKNAIEELTSDPFGEI